MTLMKCQALFLQKKKKKKKKKFQNIIWCSSEWHFKGWIYLYFYLYNLCQAERSYSNSTNEKYTLSEQSVQSLSILYTQFSNLVEPVKWNVQMHWLDLCGILGLLTHFLWLHLVCLSVVDAFNNDINASIAARKWSLCRSCLQLR